MAIREALDPLNPVDARFSRHGPLLAHVATLRQVEQNLLITLETDRLGSQRRAPGRLRAN